MVERQSIISIIFVSHFALLGLSNFLAKRCLKGLLGSGLCKSAGENAVSVCLSFQKLNCGFVDPKFQAIQTPAAQLQAADPSEARNGSACVTPFDFVCLIFIKRAESGAG